MLVVAIIGLLAAIALPKFADMITKAKEASIKGKLGSFRSALTLYYADNEGIHPRHLNTLGFLTPRYINEFPIIQVPTAPNHSPGFRVTSVGLHVPVAVLIDYPVADPAASGAPLTTFPWGYGNVNGDLVVNCSHTDSRGIVWSLH